MQHLILKHKQKKMEKSNIEKLYSKDNALMNFSCTIPISMFMVGVVFTVAIIQKNVRTNKTLHLWSRIPPIWSAKVFRHTATVTEYSCVSFFFFSEGGGSCSTLLHHASLEIGYKALQCHANGTFTICSSLKSHSDHPLTYVKAFPVDF